MPNDYRLSFADEAQWWAVAELEGWVQVQTEPAENPDDPPVVVSKSISAPGIDFDTLGVVYVQGDSPDTPPVPLPGWGVNIRFNGGDLPDDMVEFIVLPQNPIRTFAGGWFQGPKAPDHAPKVAV